MGPGMSAYDSAMATDDLVTEMAARAYRRVLEAQHPGVVWVRLRGSELERRRRPVALPLPGDVDGRVADPHDVNAAA